MRALITGACASFFMYAYTRYFLGCIHNNQTKQLFASIPATPSTFEMRDDARAPIYTRAAVPRTQRVAPAAPVRGSRARAVPVVACVALLAAVFGRVRSRAAIVTMLAEEGKEIPLTLPEDACDVESPVAKEICLSSMDGVEAASVQWVWNGLKGMGPRVKAARKKFPKVNIASLLGGGAAARASIHDEVDACDTSEETLARALCMGDYDPFSSSTGWVWGGAKASEATRPTAPKVKLGGLWGSKPVNLHEVDACDLSEGTLSRALCIEDHDPFSTGSANWVLNRLDGSAADRFSA
jgi:hypothetical protein